MKTHIVTALLNNEHTLTIAETLRLPGRMMLKIRVNNVIVDLTDEDNPTANAFTSLSLSRSEADEYSVASASGTRKKKPQFIPPASQTAC